MPGWTTGDVYGLDTLELPEGYRPLEACVAVKCIDADGRVVLLHRYTKAVSGWEVLGMAQSLVVCLEASLRDDFEELTMPDTPDPDA